MPGPAALAAAAAEGKHGERRYAKLEEDEKPLSLVLFSGTDDKLNAAAVLTVGAAAMGRPVNIFLQYYALDAFRADRIAQDHNLSRRRPRCRRRRSALIRATTGANFCARPRMSARSTSR